VGVVVVFSHLKSASTPKQTTHKKCSLSDGKYSLGNGSSLPIDCDIEM